MAVPRHLLGPADLVYLIKGWLGARDARGVFSRSSSNSQSSGMKYDGSHRSKMTYFPACRIIGFLCGFLALAPPGDRHSISPPSYQSGSIHSPTVTVACGYLCKVTGPFATWSCSSGGCAANPAPLHDKRVKSHTYPAWQKAPLGRLATHPNSNEAEDGKTRDAGARAAAGQIGLTPTVATSEGDTRKRKGVTLY